MAVHLIHGNLHSESNHKWNQTKETLFNHRVCHSIRREKMNLEHQINTIVLNYILHCRSLVAVEVETSSS